MRDAGLPPPFRLVVKINGRALRQGTGWFATRSKIVTAWHVIKDMPPSALVELEIEGGSIPLTHTPGSEDRESDIAVLQVSEADRPRIDADVVLTMANHRPERNAKWFAKGFPEKREGKQQTVHGTVAEPSGDRGRIQLNALEGTHVTWAGVSGAAVIVDDQVAGVLTDESAHPDSTLYAVPYTAAEALISELQGKARRLNYVAWFKRVYQEPAWSRSYTPMLTVNVDALNPEQLGSAIAKPNGARLWLIVGSDAEGRTALLRQVANALVENRLSANDDAFDLPAWIPTGPKSVASVADHIRENLRAPDGVDEADIEPIIADLREATRTGRALYIVDGADASDIERLRKDTVGACLLLAGVGEDVAQGFTDAQRCRIGTLSRADFKALSAHWFGTQMQRWFGDDHASLHLASRPLDVFVWCRAQLVFERLIERTGGGIEAQDFASVDGLKKLVDDAFGGKELAAHLRTTGVQRSEEAGLRDFLARLAYLTLIDGVELIEPTIVTECAHYSDVGLPDLSTIASCLARISMHCGLLQKGEGNAYRFAHIALQEYMASAAMCGSAVHLTPMAEHAYLIRGDINKISSWSRALALRLDAESDSAKNVLGTLLNFRLDPPSRIELRTRSGALQDAVLQAVLHTERLMGKRLRDALGWSESPNDWTGYRPDEWRTIEEVLRYLDGLSSRVPDDGSLACLLSRMLRSAKVIDIALIRYSLAKELRQRKLSGAPSKDLEELYERRRFFAIAGHSIDDCEKVTGKLDLQEVPEGWFFMGAPDSEERSWPNEQPRHRVRLRRYWMSRDEVTNDQYEIFDRDHEKLRCQLNTRLGETDTVSRSRHPVVRVSWYEAWCFAEWLDMSLPTEAQWEKAARGENQKDRPVKIPKEPMPFWFPLEAISSIAWFNENSRGRGTREVGESSDSPLRHKWGLAGLCGNVWEWCLDMQGRKYSKADREYPEAYPEASERNDEDVITNRMIRGGSHDSPWWNCRHAVRHFTFPTVRADTVGFRLCCEQSPWWRRSPI